MPDVDPDIDLAALRAKTQGGKMTDEEKKKRGLLYDTSKASAVARTPTRTTRVPAIWEAILSRAFK